jgi:NitT/TauT family transport system ATP-binding protein
MDEPFGALDAQTREEMQNLLLSLWQDLSHTIVFVTHDLRARSIINLHFYAPINPASTPNNVNLFLSEP